MRAVLLAHLAVALAGILFGTTFVTMKSALGDVAPIPLIAVRFLIAGCVLAPIAWGRARQRRDAGVLIAGTWCGIALLVGYVAQTVGLQYTTTSASAFITYMLVVIVPVLSALLLRRFPRVPTVAGVVLAAVGLYLMNGRQIVPGKGEAWTMLCALSFAVHILLLSELSPRHDTLRLTAVQLLLVGAACLVPGFFLGGYGFTLRAWLAAAYTAVVASIGAFALQTWGQRIVGPTRTSLLLMVEPVAAAALGYAVGERLGIAGIAGAALILAGIAVAEAPVLRRREPSPRPA